MLVIIVLYLLFVIINLQYIKRDKDLPKAVGFIVILSASYNSVTLKRLKTGLNLLKRYPKAIAVACGRTKSGIIKDFFRDRGISKAIVQDKSLNTYEDAVYLRARLPDGKNTEFILISSSGHQRRAYNTFKRVFEGEIWNHPSNDLFSFYSPLLPTGWFVNLVNVYKDIKYNRKVF